MSLRDNVLLLPLPEDVEEEEEEEEEERFGDKGLFRGAASYGVSLSREMLFQRARQLRKALLYFVRILVGTVCASLFCCCKYSAIKQENAI